MQKFPIDSHSNENFICLFPPAGGRQPPNYLVPVPGVCSTLSQNFTPIAPSCVEISSTVQKTKQKANLISRQTLRYAVWRDKKNHIGQKLSCNRRKTYKVMYTVHTNLPLERSTLGL